MSLYLIQRGIFKNSGTSLTGPNGVVRLDYMGSAEFEWGAIPKAFRRLMYHFEEYSTFNTGIFTPEHQELLVFCRKSCSEEVLQEIQRFVEHPYHLKEWSDLEKIPTAKKGNSPFERRSTNFWWCIDTNSTGDWMAFLQPQAALLMQAVKTDHKKWWLAMTPEDREKEYKNSLRW